MQQKPQKITPYITLPKGGPHVIANQHIKKDNTQDRDVAPHASAPAKGSDQRRHRGVGRTHGSAEPTLKCVQVHIGGKDDLILLKAVCNITM